MAHPRVLYLCEEILRRHRWREAKVIPRSSLSPQQLNVLL